MMVKNFLEPGGAIKKVSETIDGPFFVLYGDSYLDICYKDVYDFYISNNNKALMSIIENNNKWDKSNILFRNNEIVSYKKKHDEVKMRHIDYGLSIFEKRSFKKLWKK